MIQPYPFSSVIPSTGAPLPGIMKHNEIGATMNSEHIRSFFHRTTIILAGLFALAIFAIAQPALAATVTWDGDSDGDGDNINWSDRFNWDGDAVPQSEDTIIIYPSGGGQVYLDTDFDLFGMLNIKGAGTVLNVDAGKILTLDSSLLSSSQKNISLQSNGSMLNNGTINGFDSYQVININSSSTFTNDGTINDISIGGRGTLTNNGTMNTVRIGFIAGDFINSGLIDNVDFNLQIGTYATNQTGGVINIDLNLMTGGTRFLSGTVFDNFGTITNPATITINNEGPFNNFGTFHNLGAFINNCNVFTGTAGIFNNSGALTGNSITETCGIWDNDTGNGLWSDPVNWNSNTFPDLWGDIIISNYDGVDANVTIDEITKIHGRLGLLNANVTVAADTTFTGRLALKSSIVTANANIKVSDTLSLLDSELFIQNGKTLTNTNIGSILVTSNSTINNAGSIINNGEVKASSCTAEIINTGTISGNPFLFFCITWDGDSDGDGDDSNWSDRFNWDTDTLPQSGDTIVISPSGGGQVYLDTNFNLVGVLNIKGNGTVLDVNAGVILTLDSSFLSSSQKNITLENNGSMLNNGTINGVDSYQVISINSSSTFTNDGTINDISIGGRGTLTNNGTMNTVRIGFIAGDFINSGLIDNVDFNLQIGTYATNQTGGVINIDLNLMTGGTRFLSGTVFDNFGMITNPATITSASDSTFTNFGTFDNTNGIYQNDGTFNIECDSVLLGVITGNAPVVAICDTTPPEITVPASFTVEATSAAGAVATYSASANDDTDGALTPSCSPASGSTLPLGPNTVTCTATDAADNEGTASFTITVEDTTDPVLTVPGNVTAEANGNPNSTVSIGTATATDLFTPVTVTNNAPTGYPLGPTVVTWTATDGNGLTATATQTVTVVDTTAPVMNQPPDILGVEATSQYGAAVSYSASAEDIVDGGVVAECVPDSPVASPYTFALGSHTITCDATDAAGNTSTPATTFTVEVVDTTDPSITAPADVTEEATGPKTPVEIGTPTVSDIADLAPEVTNDAPADYPVGTTVVTWTATDASGNFATDTQNVTVEDKTPPMLTVPADKVVEATSDAGAEFSWEASAEDIVDGSITPVCTPASGSVFAISSAPGQAIPVTCTAEDNAGNSAASSFNVTVRDTTKPDLTVPGNITAEATSSTGAVVTFSATATDSVDASPTVVCDPASGSTFPIGNNTVTCTATDWWGNSDATTFAVNVQYIFSGFLSPLKPDGTYKLGRTLPVKFQLFYAGGSPALSATANIQWQLYSESEPVGEPFDTVSTSAADSGNTFRLSGDTYIYNLSTEILSKGHYGILVDVGDGSDPYSIVIGFK